MMLSGPFRSPLLATAGFVILLSFDGWAETQAVNYNDQIRFLLALTPASITSEQIFQKYFDEIEMIVRETSRIGDLETALSLADKGFVLAPDQLRSGFLLGWVRGSLGRLDSAVDTLRKALRGKTDRLPDPEGTCKAETLTHLGGFLIQQGKNQEAIPFLEHAHGEKSATALPDYLLGEAYHHLNDPEKAESAFQSAFSRDESLATPVDYLFYAWALDKKGKSHEVQNLLNQAIGTFPVAPALHLNRGLNHEVLSNTREAFFDYQLELLTEPGGPYADTARKRIERIERVQVTVRESDPLLKAVIELLAYRKENKKSEAGTLLSTISQADGLKSPYVIYLYSEMMIEQGQALKAVDILTSALDVNPTEFLLQVNLAEAYAKAGEKDKADGLIRDLLILAPNHWKLQQLLGPR